MKTSLLLACSGLVLAAACGSDATNSANTGTTPETTVLATDPAPTTPPTTEAPPAPAVPTTSDFTPVTDPPVTEPPATVAPTTAPPPVTTTALVPTTGTAVVYGGSGGESPWVPLAWWDGAAGVWNPAGYPVDGGFVVPPAPTIGSVSATSLDLPDGPGQVIDGLALGPEDFYCVGDEMGPTILPPVEIPDTPVSLGYDALAVTADWPLQPRPVQQIGADNPEYATLGASLSSSPTAASGTVSQVVRADLDGDGIEEVLVTYQYLTDDQFGAANDFSLIYARYPAPDGSVTDQVIDEYVLADPTEFPTIGRLSIAAVADLNGDGVMEVATRSSFWESAAIAVWSFDGDGLTPVAAGGCGV